MPLTDTLFSNLPIAIVSAVIVRVAISLEPNSPTFQIPVAGSYVPVDVMNFKPFAGQISLTTTSVDASGPLLTTVIV